METRKEISYQWQNPISKDWENAHQVIEQLGNRAIPVDAKGRSWNTGLTAYNKKRAWKVMDKSGRFCSHVIEIWYRNDGYHNRCFKYETEQAYDNYVEQDETPHAIANEIGL